ncbi:terminase [bacterium]|nr:terminase [bacterium]|tara:strand:+ start:379 stop:1689 length:1311 start_codon:yes stop_codon:yes gene_type:complete
MRKKLKQGIQKIRIAVASGHGIGKSALIAQIINWGLSTHEDTKVLVTSNTDTQLKTKTWPEIAKWHQMSITRHWFKFEATSIYSIEPGHKDLWRCDRIPWSERNPQAFAGLHNKKKRIIIIFDEASSIADIIWETIDGAMTDEDTEIIWIAFGNPTLNTGRFRECFRKFSKRWITRQIDSRNVEGTDKYEINAWIEDWGLDSDFVKVRVRGLFPNSSAKQFISTEDVDSAYGRALKKEQYEFAPVIIGCDPAWEGDDVLTIGLRQGLMSKKLAAIPKNDNDIEVATILARFEDDYQADAVFIDMGYGTGIYSAGKTLGRNWQLVNSASTRSVLDPGCLNKRAEMWKSIRDWLKSGGSIPKDPKMYQQLIAPETVPRADGKLQIEPKPLIKKRIGESTDEADWLGLTFAYPVAMKGIKNTFSNKMKSDYDPYAEDRI